MPPFAYSVLSGARIPHPGTLVDCELLLHFDESLPTSWRDYSIKQHPVNSLVSFAPGSVSADAQGYFSGCLNLTQAHPGSGDDPDANTQSYIDIGGENIHFDAGEFFMSALVKIAAYPVDFGFPTGSYTLASTTRGNSGSTPGWQFRITATGAVSISFGNGGALVSGGIVPLNTWVQVAVSRMNRPLLVSDLFTAFIDGVSVGVDASRPADATEVGARTLIGCIDISTTTGLVKLSRGFEGLMDELFIVKGDGTGISTDFTPPSRPYSQRNRLPPFTP